MARSKSKERGFAAMVQDDPDRQREIASEGGQASGSKFTKDSKHSSRAGKTGSSHESMEAKRKGGEHSRHNT